MNIDFTYHNPTCVHFGKNALDYLPGELSHYGPEVLLVYGKQSIRKSGLYDTLIRVLKDCGKNVRELPGINSNPRYAQVMEGARMVREQHTDLLLAVGGGSVIDCCKAISASAYCEGDPWSIYWEHGEALRNPVVPVGCVLTMCGTASEMNSGSVITHEEKKLKLGRVFPLAEMTPRFAIINPELTYSVPEYQMVSGIFDIFSHLMEQYFGGEDDCVSDYLLEGCMLALISAARKAKQNPLDYEARSNIAWCATMALNKILAVSKKQDWEVHQIEHQIGAYCDCAHGIGLAVISVPYYRMQYRYGLPRFERFARNVWKVGTEGKSGEQIALEGIECLSRFIDEMGIPRRLRDLGCTEDMLPLIAESCNKTGDYHVPTTAEVLEVLKACY